MKHYDYLIVGAGLFGSVFAHQAALHNKGCLVIDKRDHIAGNAHTALRDDILVHVYGAHIFHTENRGVWNYVNRLADFNRYTNSPIANYRGEIYNMPFNMNTFNRMWQVATPAEAEAVLQEQRAEVPGEPCNLEEQAIKLVGRDLYEKLVKGYTEKQWGSDCKDLPAFIIRRLPVRFTYDNNYFNDPFQGIPVQGYDHLVAQMLSDADVELNCDFFANREELMAAADRVVYTGPIDQYFDYRFGPLRWRTLRFETETLDMPNYQGVAVVNYTDRETPYTRVIEHKHFNFGTQPKTVISREYSAEWVPGDEPYYPVNDDANQAVYRQYQELAGQTDVIFGGRLAEYRYYNMDQVIEQALRRASAELSRYEIRK